MKLSIIIPVYNVELYIEKCLLSVLNQSNLNDTEIILVDDCGTDNSMDVVKKIVREYSNSYNIKIISHIQNQGLSAARNTGVRNAEGDYLFFLDSDDELPENTIVTFNNYLNKYENVDFFVGNYIINGPFNGIILNNRKIEYENNNEILNAYINNEWYVMACGKFISRQFFISNDLWFPKKRLHEDELFSFKLALCAKTMVVIEEYSYRYIIRSNSITSLKRRKNYIDYFWIITRKIDLFNKSHIDSKSDINKSMDNYLKQLLFNYIVFVVLSKLKKNEKIILLKWTKNKYKHFKWMQISLKNLVSDFIMIFSPCFIMFIIDLIFNRKSRAS